VKEKYRYNEIWTEGFADLKENQVRESEHRKEGGDGLRLLKAKRRNLLLIQLEGEAIGTSERTQ